MAYSDVQKASELLAAKGRLQAARGSVARPWLEAEGLSAEVHGAIAMYAQSTPLTDYETLLATKSTERATVLTAISSAIAAIDVQLAALNV